MRTTRIISLALFVLVTTQIHAGDVLGWRNDGSGRYSKAKPPTDWGPDKNLVWATPMPKWSNSSPIIVGEKIFTCSEPDVLICCSLTDGKLLWQKANPFDKCISPEDKARMDEMNEKAAPLNEELKPLATAEAEAKKKWSTDKKNKELRKAWDEARKKVWEVRKKLGPLTIFGPGRGRTHRAAGYSTPTPCSDGKHVYIHTGTRIVACYDLDGNRKWARVTEKTMDGRGHSTSPLLIGDKLLVHVNNLVAYDKLTGKEIWRVGAKWGWGSLAAAKIGDVDVVITPKGDVFKAADGAKICNVGAGLAHGTPLVLDGVVHVLDKRAVACKVPEKISEKTAFTPLCKYENKLGLIFSSPQVVDGLTYITGRGSYKDPVGKLQVFDAATGKLVYSKELGFKPKSFQYANVTLAGKYLYLSNETGDTIVLEPGREYKEVARNKLGDGCRGNLVFRGDRMYVRGLKKLYCFGSGAKPANGG